VLTRGLRADAGGFGPDVGQVVDPQRIHLMNREVAFKEGPRSFWHGDQASSPMVLARPLAPWNTKLGHQTAHGSNRNVDSTAL